MTAAREVRNVPASVRQRLLNLAHAQKVEFNVILGRFAAERFIYRLSVSDEVDRFTLKGAALFRVWNVSEIRPTRDVDFLASGPNGHPTLRAALEAICRIPCSQDGVVFDPSAIRMYRTRVEQGQSGVQAQIQGRLGQARLPLRLDISFGDIIRPERQERDYPTLLDLPVPRLWTYPCEALVAEKFHAMVRWSTNNTRMKDLWDIACLARRLPFGGETVRSAIEGTFKQRQTLLAGERPVSLLPEYYEDERRGQRWHELRRTMAADADGPDQLADVGRELRTFLGPVCDSLINDKPFTDVWPSGGPWAPATAAAAGEEGP